MTDAFKIDKSLAVNTIEGRRQCNGIQHSSMLGGNIMPSKYPLKGEVRPKIICSLQKEQTQGSCAGSDVTNFPTRWRAKYGLKSLPVHMYLC